MGDSGGARGVTAPKEPRRCAVGEAAPPAPRPPVGEPSTSSMPVMLMLRDSSSDKASARQRSAAQRVQSVKLAATEEQRS